MIVLDLFVFVSPSSLSIMSVRQGQHELWSFVLKTIVEEGLEDILGFLVQVLEKLPGL